MATGGFESPPSTASFSSPPGPGPEFGGFVLSARGHTPPRVPLWERDRRPPPHAPLSSQGLWPGTRRRRCQQSAPSRGRRRREAEELSAPPTSGPGGEAAGQVPRAGDRARRPPPAARRRPYLLEKGPREPGPPAACSRGSAPGAPGGLRGARVPCARGCSALGAGAAGAARPAALGSAALRPARRGGLGGRSPASAATLAPPRAARGPRAGLQLPGAPLDPPCPGSASPPRLGRDAEPASLRSRRAAPPGLLPPPSHALTRRDRASRSSPRSSDPPLRVLPPPALRRV